MPAAVALFSVSAAVCAWGCGGGGIHLGAGGETLDGEWDGPNRERLEALIGREGRGAKGYDPSRPPVAVFDWDNTSIIGDVQETVFLYQLEHLAFAMNPEELGEAIRSGVPGSDFVAEYSNTDGEPISIDDLAGDIQESYRILWERSGSPGGTETLGSVAGSEEHLEFVAKMTFAYQAIGASFDHRVSYPWVIYLLSGFTDEQVAELSREAFAEAIRSGIREENLESPSRASRAGAVRVEITRGIRLSSKMRSLYHELSEGGFEVYVCSASYSAVVKAMAASAEYGYRLDPGNVIAMELEKDPEGRLLPEYRRGYPMTQAEGKTEALRSILPRPPVFIAGDSDGDVDMLTAFEETKLRLVIDRGKIGPIADLVERARRHRERPDPTWLVEKR